MRSQDSWQDLQIAISLLCKICSKLAPEQSRHKNKYIPARKFQHSWSNLTLAYTTKDSAWFDASTDLTSPADGAGNRAFRSSRLLDRFNWLPDAHDPQIWFDSRLFYFLSIEMQFGCLWALKKHYFHHFSLTFACAFPIECQMQTSWLLDDQSSPRIKWTQNALDI